MVGSRSSVAGRFAAALASCALVVAFAACSGPPREIGWYGELRAERAVAPASQDTTAQAQAALEAFFQAWAAKDEHAAEALLSPDRRGLSWRFESLDHVTFGSIDPAPEWTDLYMSNGHGSVNGVARGDVRSFSAPVTFYYKPGQTGTVASGQQLDWSWTLIRVDGEWLVDDWGY
jgi:hypothetical protein